ncbi:MAG: ACP S-malonyltransferase [Candidatus Electryonea clarkiae]|nr:ACP S-malonyltransferase [Candidatus Electryonea clarkiae]MDP8287379.1 ACP S-malonyltransferase [Candidatus Electryonea clarkiae]
MNSAFLFPGQASQYVGMGKDLYESYDIARFYFDQADRDLPFDFLKICFEGPEEDLKQTRVTQPAIFVHSVIVNELLRQKKFPANVVAGHSIGEYSALVSSGALKFTDALEVVALRGELMQYAGEERPGAMAAIIGLDLQQIEEICNNISDTSQVVVAANLNAPGQIVISGDVQAVEKAMEFTAEAGAKKTIRLVVSGAFHSPLMEPAAEKLGREIEHLVMRQPDVPIYMNVTGKPENSQNEIKKLLMEQLTHPVRWEETILNMSNSGIERFVEVGPGKVLRGLVKRIVKGTTLLGVDKKADIEKMDLQNIS